MKRMLLLVQLMGKGGCARGRLQKFLGCCWAAMLLTDVLSDGHDDGMLAGERW